MFKNYLLLTWRNLLKSKIYSIIHIAGLSIGLACAMLMLLYVKDEVSFDQFHSNVNNIYRVVTKTKQGDKEYKDGNTGYLQGPGFTQNIPGIKNFVRIQSGTEDVKLDNEMQSQDLLYVDSSFFSVFSFPLIDGSAADCLKEPHSVVLSEDAAKKHFGTTMAVGKSLMIKEDSILVPYKVTAVAKRVPQNSSIQFEMLLPIKMSKEDAVDKDNWYNFFLNTFVVLDEKANLQNVEAQMQRYYIKDASAAFKRMIEKYGGGPDPNMGTYFLQPYLDMHLSTELPPQNGLTNASNPMYSYILSGIALFILLIACINFVNLTIARSVKRAKEIGIRKVVGSGRSQLIAQFLGESFMLCTIAFALALLIAQLLLPFFNTVTNKSLAIKYLFDIKLIAAYLALYVCTAFLAGFYPALVLSGYNPVETLYSRFRLKGKNYLQKSLVVLQFSLASSLIIGTLIIYSQFNFLTKTNPGYDDSNVVMVNNRPMKHSEAAVFKNELKKNPNILEVSAKNGGYWKTGAKLGNDSSILFAYETIDEAFLPLLKLQMVEGRNFSTESPSDSNNNILVNEAFVKEAKWKKPLGEIVNFFYYNNEIYHVIGVVKDYHYQSLNQKIEPQLFTMKNANEYGKFFIKIKPGTETESLKHIQKTFKQFYPMNPYAYVFMDQENRKSYAAEEKWKQIMLFGAILTIFISCIGLFGLSVTAAERRIKEIGVRKVLGSSVQGIVAILSKDFVALVAIALFIAIPAAWFAGNKWLENYPYRTDISWGIFALAALLVVMVALFTVSFQAIKAALANPVKSLRTE